MEEAGKESGSASIYWTHFKSIHFIQYLRSGYDRQLPIPEDFARNFKKKLGAETVALKGPSGYTWSVGITEKDGNLFFNSGWPEFVGNHSLNENDILFFRYKRDSSFEVLMLDGKSQCEKPDSYFVHKRAPEDHAPTECQTKRKAREASPEDHFTDSHTDSSGEDSPPEKWALADANNRSTPRRRIRRGSSSIRRRARTRSVNSDAEDPCFTGSVNSSPQYVSNRRPVTQDEIDKAYHLAKAAAAPEDILVVMKPSHVYRRFYLTIPQNWIKEHLTYDYQDIILRLKDRIWTVKFYLNKARGQLGGLSSGWMKFSLDNNLEEHDVCVLKLANAVTKPVILIVTIFRVVDEIVLPTRVGRPTRSRYY